MKNLRFQRKIRGILFAAIFLYLVALVGAWWFGTLRSYQKAVEILTNAEKSFADVISGEIDGVLRYVAGNVINLLDRQFGVQPLSRLQTIATMMNIDELNLINRDGRVISSNLPQLLNADFNHDPRLCPFMELTNGTVSCVSQPFRSGVVNPHMYCKYLGLSFPGHTGILQIGMSIDRLRANMYDTTKEESAQTLRDWHFSISGWYERAEEVADFEPGKVFWRFDPVSKQMTICRYFQYYQFQYMAVLPVSHGAETRNSVFFFTALAAAVLLAVFTLVLIRLAHTSEKVEALHAAADARTAADLLLARQIQMAALPTSTDAFLECLSFEIAAASYPAREVGGDFFDFCRLSEDRVAFLIADVSGKGIPAAMFMMEAKSVLQNCLMQFDDLSEAVRQANMRLCVKNEAQMFVTAWVGVLWLQEGRVEYVNAGHNRPFVRHAEGTVEKVMGKGGLFLGLFAEATYQAKELLLRPGDRLLLYTDGLTEAMNAHQELFGEARLRAALVRDELESAHRNFVGDAEASDDLTTFTLNWLGTPATSVREFSCEETALDEVMSFLREGLKGVSSRMLARLMNAADEVASNVVNYSKAKTFSVRLERNESRVKLTFIDAGQAYNPLSHVDPDTHATIEQRPIGGLGLVVVKKLMDRVSYVRERDQNVLFLIKRLSEGGLREQENQVEKRG